MNSLQNYLLGSLFASVLTAMPVSMALAQQTPQPPEQTTSTAAPAYGPGMMGYGYGPGHGMGPGMMGYGSGGYGMGPGMMSGVGYGMGPGMMGGFGCDMGSGMMGGMGLAGLDLSSAQIDKISKISGDLFRTQSALMLQMFKARLSAQKEINAVLTKEQQIQLQRGWGGRWNRGMMGY